MAYSYLLYCNFCAEEVDGETLLMLVTLGSVEQYKACGLTTIKDQMKLRKLIGSSVSSQSSTSASSSSAKVSTTPSRGKLTKKFLQDLTPEDKRVYLSM